MRVILRAVVNFVDEYLELRRTLRYGDIRTNEKSAVQMTRLDRSLAKMHHAFCTYSLGWPTKS